MKARDLKTFLFYLMKFVIFVNISFRILTHRASII